MAVKHHLTNDCSLFKCLHAIFKVTCVKTLTLRGISPQVFVLLLISNWTIEEPISMME